MVPTTNLLAFLLVAVPIILAPGPSVLFAIGRSISLGRVGGVLSVLGNALGFLVVALAVAVGLGALIAQSVAIFTVVKIAGAGYLIYLGVQAIRHRKVSAAAATESAAPRSVLRLLLQGFIVGISNPKTIVFFLAVLPQFVDYSAGGVPMQMLELGALFVIVAFCSDSVWALAAGFARDWFARSPRRLEVLGASGGVMMIGLGTVSLFTGRGKQ